VSDVLRTALKPDILELVEQRDWTTLQEVLRTQPATDIVELLDAVSDSDALILYRLLPRKLAEEVFDLLPVELQNRLVRVMSRDEAAAVIEQMSPDDRTALLEELPAPVARRLLDMLPEGQRRVALALLNYPEDSVGRLMTTAYVRVQPEWTREQVLDHIRQVGSDSETLEMLYVTDERERLIDDIGLRQIVLANPGTRVAELMDRRFVALRADQDRETAVREFRKYDLYAMPVVDSEGHLLGIVTHDDVLQVATQEATEDFHRIGTVQPLRTRFAEAAVGLLIRRRVSWLLALVGANLISGSIIGKFENLIAANVVLTFFLPLLIDSGGNCGSQSSTLVVRALATGDIAPRDAGRLLVRELVVGLLLGLLTAAVVFVLGWWRGGLPIAEIVALAMASIVLVCSVIGLMLPFLLSWLGFDPAMASAPLITTLADITGVTIYFLIASRWLIHGSA
jgi:magnesium transporter